jgi:Flp pilus assembly pilin Flp
MSKTLEKLYAKIRRLIGGECGQDLVEYGMLVTLIALMCISGMQSTANSVNDMFGEVSQALVTGNQQPAQQQQQSPPQHQHHHHGGGGGWGWWH